MSNYTKDEIENDFSYLTNDDMERLVSIFSGYDFYEICKAVYCFNSYLGNRSHLELSLLLNLALTRCDKNGTMHISNYESFKSLVESYFFPLRNPIWDDPVATDNGEVRIFFGRKFYKVYLGNSYNLSFPLYQSMDCVCEKCGIVDKVIKAFEYTDEQISKYKCNGLPADYDYSMCYLPPLEYFQEVFEHFKAVDSDEFFVPFSNEKETDISKTHFIFWNDKLIPLFNTSLIIDAYHLATKGLLDDSVCNYSFCESLIKNYDLFLNSNHVLINAAIVDNLDKHTIIDNFVFNAAMFDKTTLVLFSNINAWKTKGYLEIKKKAESKKKNGNLYIAELAGDKTRVVHLDFIKTIVFISYIPELNVKGGYSIPRDKDIFCYNVLDLIHLFYQSEDLSDLVEFFGADYNGAFDAFQFSFTGNITKYNYWIANQKQVSRGAIDFDMISTGVYDDEYSIINRYKAYDTWFTFNKPSPFYDNPFQWKTHSSYLGFIEISDKSQSHFFGGQIRKVDDCSIFFSQNLELYESKDQHTLVSLQTIQEIQARYFVLLEQALKDSGFYSRHNIKFLHLPLDKARDVDNTGFTKTNNEYVFSDSMIYLDVLEIRYAVDFDKFETDLIKAKDNAVELKYISELLSCIKTVPYINFSKIEEGIRDLSGGKRKVKIATKEFKFFISGKTYEHYVNTESTAKAQKEIAIACQKAGLNPGLYDKKDFSKRVRKLQKLIIPKFESILSDFDKFEIHIALLSRLSAFVLGKTINSDRVDLKNDDGLDDDVRFDCENNIVKANERYVSYIRLIRYAIDTNLSINHTGCNKPTFDDIDYILAFSERLMLIQNSSDEAHYNLFPISLNVDTEYLIDVIYPDELANFMFARSKRRMEILSYIPVVDEGIAFLNDVIQNFFLDTGVYINKVFDVCEYLKYEFTYKFKIESDTNVFKINYAELISDLFSVFPNVDCNELKNAFDYLIIDETGIKKLGNGVEEFVPVWEREKRVNRIETKPIVKDGEYVIFSPIVINDFEEQWKKGIFNFYPLYEYGLDHFLSCLEEWKHKCEKKMEADIQNLFPEGSALKNVNLHKRDKGYDHPENLGDYDVLGIDVNNKILYNLESKYLAFTGSIREYFNQQDGFFNKDERDKKFQQRIDYLLKHKDRILNVLFKIENGNEFIIKNYMVTNKLFCCDVKKIDFEIITFSELRSILGLDGKVGE